MSNNIHTSKDVLTPISGTFTYTDPSGRDIYDSYDAGELPDVEVRALALPNRAAIAYEMQKRRNDLRKRNTLSEDDPRVIKAKKFQEEQQALRAIADMQIDGTPPTISHGANTLISDINGPALPIAGTNDGLLTYFPTPTRVTPSIEVLQPKLPSQSRGSHSRYDIVNHIIDIVPANTYDNSAAYNASAVDERYDPNTYYRANALPEITVTAPARTRMPEFITDWGKRLAKIVHDQSPAGRAGKIGYPTLIDPTSPEIFGGGPFGGGGAGTKI